jgi:hypothetical protein
MCNYKVLNNFLTNIPSNLMSQSAGDCEMEIASSAQNENIMITRKMSKRLTPLDYANAGILKPYDRSAKEREAHDKLMEKYRLYLMKLCTLSSDLLEHEFEESE